MTIASLRLRAPGSGRPLNALGIEHWAFVHWAFEHNVGMPDFAVLEQILASALQLTRRPVAVAFRDTPPPGVEKFTGSMPSGCSFWRLAADGRAFYTVPSDHHNCPIGSYTHNFPLPAGREPDLTTTLSLMSDIGYIRMEEVPALPRLAKTPAVAVYAPLAATPVDPDAVVISGKAARVMLLHEAAIRSDKKALPMLGRPTCMAIPAAIGGGLASSLACIGSRVYTDVADDEFYTVIAGTDLSSIMGQLETIVSANEVLAEYHRDRRASLATAMTHLRGSAAPARQAS